MFPSQLGGEPPSAQQQESCALLAEATEQPCTENEALLILEQFEKVYRDKIDQVETAADVTDVQRNELKVKIMTDWIKDLREQNTLLIQTVHDLEQTAVCRVKLLEDKLHETSHLMTHNMSQPHKSEEDLNEMAKRIQQLESDQNCMQKNVELFQSDIDNLLELIKRGRIENDWNLEGLTFYQIQPSDIPAPSDCTCGQEKEDAQKFNYRSFIEQKEENEKLLLHIQKLEDNKSQLQIALEKKNNNAVELRDSLITTYLKNRNYSHDLSSVNSPIGCVIDNQENVINNKDLKIENLYKQLNSIEKNYNNLQHEYQCKTNEFQTIIEDNSKLQKENKQLRAWLACEKKESSEAREALAQEVAQKYDSILELKKMISHLEDQIQDSKSVLHFKEDIITQLRLDLKTAKSGSVAPRRVRISHDSSQMLEDRNVDEKLNDAIRQIEELKSLLTSKDIEISKLKTVSENSSENINRKIAHSPHNVSVENQGEILAFLTNLSASMAKDIETILSLKMEYETVLAKLEQTKFKYEEDITLANEMLQDIQSYLHQYKNEVLDHDECNDNIRECINTMENKIIHTQKLFQNNCERCVKENLLLEMNEVISKVSSGIKTVSEIYENKNKSITSIKILINKNSAIYDKNTAKEYDQKVIFTAILQQFRMMEEFRICTVEVQAATEDLREEMTSVISNLNSRHCKYVELTKMVSQVQDYLTRTRENISEIINRLELQDEERARHNERITNNRIRLKDIKNEFNHTQSELKKCLNNVHSNIQSNLLEYTEIYTCNDLLTSVVEEVEQLVCNLHAYQSQGSCGLSTMTELRKQLTLMEHNVKELKKKCDQVLIENEAAQKSFTDKSKRLEKYECEVDNCHTKMQDVLENIIAIRDKLNEFECIKEVDNSFESTNETIKLKEEMRNLQKECEELKRKLLQESSRCQKDDRVSEWENRIIDLKDQITVLQNEMKLKQEANIFLKQSIETLEKELESMRIKAEAYRRGSSMESFEMKKRIFELENLLRVQKDAENNVKSLENNETDSKKSQQLFDFYTKDRLADVATKHSLQGSHENVAQLFNVLQDTIQAIKSGLQELGDKLKRSVSDGSSHACNSSESVRAAIEMLAKYVESIKYCSFEIEKIKAALYSKDKLMENKDEIIRIQKDSITISQSEVEDLHKTLQEKIDAQEKAIIQCEKEKRQLNKQIELQVQTIGHLQEAVVEAKRTIDQLSNKATSDNFNKGQIIRSLNLYLAETQSQYNDSYGEASEQAALLELQRDAISTLQKRISFLKYDEFLNAFILHFVYYVILLKYQEKLDSKNQKFSVLKSTMHELEYAKNDLERQCCNLQNKNHKVHEENNKLRSSYENSCKAMISEKQQIEMLHIEINDLKYQLQTYKFDFNIIEEEMKKMGVIDLSIKNFKSELQTMRLKNERYKKTIDELKFHKNCLTKKLSELKVQNEKYKTRNSELSSAKEKIEELEVELRHAEFIMNDQFKKIQCLENNIRSFELYFLEQKNYQKENEFLRDNLVRAETKLESAELKEKLLQQELHMARAELLKTQMWHANTLNNLCKHAVERNNFEGSEQSENAICQRSEVKKNDGFEQVSKLNKNLKDVQEQLSAKTEALSDVQAKYNMCSSKFESSEKRYKDEIMLLEKKLACLNQRFQTCTEKNAELVRQNKSLEDNYNKCMTELEDIVLQLEDMQSSLVELRTECDTKAQSLDCLSTELAKMKVSRSEVCEETKHVLGWVRIWMKEQKRTACTLQERLRDKQQQLSHISHEKRNSMASMKRLKRANMILRKRLKFIRKPATKQTTVVCNGHALASRQDKSFFKQNDGNIQKNVPIASYSHFKKEYREKQNGIVEKSMTKGHYKWYPGLIYLSNQIPKTAQVSKSIQMARQTHEDTTDGGYNTSSAR